MCVGGVLAARSQESCLRHSQLWSRHSQPQSAYLSAVRACDHVNTSNATAKCQVARGFHIHTTHCQHIFQKNTDFTKNPGFSSKYCILMVLRFSHICHVFLGLQTSEPVGTQLLPNGHLTRIAPERSNLGSESHSSGPKWSGYDSETLFTITKP